MQQERLCLNGRYSFVLEQIRGFAAYRTIRQTSTIFGISIPRLTAISKEHGFNFAGQEGRPGGRVATSILNRERAHVCAVVDRNLNSKRSTVQQGTLDFSKIPPHLLKLSKESLHSRHNSFVERLIRLGRNHTEEEVQKITGMSAKSLARYKYDFDLVFKQPKPQSVIAKPKRPQVRKLFGGTDIAKLMCTYVASDVDDEF